MINDVRMHRSSFNQMLESVLPGLDFEGFADLWVLLSVYLTRVSFQMLAPKKKMEESSTCVAFCVDRNPTNYGFVRAARVLIFPLSFVGSLSYFQFIVRTMFINVRSIRYHLPKFKLQYQYSLWNAPLKYLRGARWHLHRHYASQPESCSEIVILQGSSYR